MPQLTLDQLDRLARQMLLAAGTPEDIADVVAGSLVGASLKGVDSHGVMQLPYYLEEIAKGHIDPAARPTVEAKAPGLALVRGNKGFGMYALGQATETAIEIAGRQGSACVGLADCGHTGRLGHFAETAARRGLFALVFGGGAHETWRNVVPFGGSRPVVSTNPYAFAMPGGRFGPIVVDFATSTVADGKVAVYRAEGKTLPEGWILDKHGRPSRDPADLFDGGMHLPAAGHKGYGLGLIAELVGDAVLNAPPEFNWFVITVDLGFFRPAEAYSQSAERFLQFVKDVPPAEGVQEVLLPGEPERRAEECRRKDGVPMPESVWQRLSEAAQTVGLDLAAVVKLDAR